MRDRSPRPQLLGDGPSDSAARAGHQCLAAGQLQIHRRPLSGLRVRGWCRSVQPPTRERRAMLTHSRALPRAGGRSGRRTSAGRRLVARRRPGCGRPTWPRRSGRWPGDAPRAGRCAAFRVPRGTFRGTAGRRVGAQQRDNIRLEDRAAVQLVGQGEVVDADAHRMVGVDDPGGVFGVSEPGVGPALAAQSAGA